MVVGWAPSPCKQRQKNELDQLEFSGLQGVQIMLGFVGRRGAAEPRMRISSRAMTASSLAVASHDGMSIHLPDVRQGERRRLRL